jgi:uncharacterized protein
MRPGVNITTRENAPPSTVPTDVGTGFMVGVTESGPAIPSNSNLVQNLDEYIVEYAPSGRNYAPGVQAFDAADRFYAEGGNRLFVGRVMGAGAATSTINITDGTAAVSLVVTAKNPGLWGNALTAKIIDNAGNPNIPAGSYRIQVIKGGNVQEESYDLTDPAGAVGWANSSGLVNIAQGASALKPAVGTFALAAGTDGGAIANPDWQTAFNSLSVTLGPGILFAPGATTSSIHSMAAEAARVQGRVAFLDGPDTQTAVNLITAAKAVIDQGGKRSRFSGLFTPWLYVPGLTPNTTRKIPPSPAVAGVFCRNMGAGRSANEPSAGEQGRFLTVIDVARSYSDSDRQDMNANGVNVIRDIYGVRKIYGWRTTADPVNDTRWINLGNSIMHRQIIALAGAVGERFIFRQIDGQGRLMNEFGGALIGEVCMPLFFSGSLYGEDPGDAFKVDVGPSVNTAATIANNELRAVISVRMSPFGEEVNIQIVKYLVTESIPI